MLYGQTGAPVGVENRKASDESKTLHWKACAFAGAALLAIVAGVVVIAVDGGTGNRHCKHSHADHCDPKPSTHVHIDIDQTVPKHPPVDHCRPRHHSTQCPIDHCIPRDHCTRAHVNRCIPNNCCTNGPVDQCISNDRCINQPIDPFFQNLPLTPIF
jgi:hypothetical protein